MKTTRSKLFAFSRIALATLATLFGVVRPASADYLWDWSYTCHAPLSKCQGGSGQYTSTMVAQGDSGNPYYVLTGITGTTEGNTITALLAPGSLGLANDNKISAYAGPSEGTPFSHDPSHTITGIGFLVNGDAPTVANRSLLFQNFIDDFVGDYTQILLPNGVSLLNVDFDAKLVGVVDNGSQAPEPGSLMLVGTGILSAAGLARRRFLRSSRTHRPPLE